MSFLYKPLRVFVFKSNYSSFKFILLANLITVIGNEMSVYSSRFANVWSHIKKIGVIFTHMKLWVAVARHNFMWAKIKMIEFSASRVEGLNTFMTTILLRQAH